MEAHRVVIPYGFWKRQVLIGLPVVAGLAIAVWMCERQEGWPFYLVLLLFAMVLSVFLETEINPKQSVIIRRWSLFKIVPLWRKRYSVSDFVSVGARFSDDEDGNRTWHIQLKAKSGGRLGIKWFGFAKELPAEAFNLQTQIADMTGLPIRNEIH